MAFNRAEAASQCGRRRRLVPRSAAGRAGLAIVAAWVLCGVAWPLLAPYDPWALDPQAALKPPSPAHWFGTDLYGRDVLSRVLAGSRSTLAVAPVATAVAVALGTLLGLAGAYWRGWVDEAAMRLVDAVMAFPVMVLSLLALTFLGDSTLNVIAVVALVFTPLVARTVRAAALAERGREYVEAAQLRGEPPLAIMLTEILPNVVGPLAVEATLRLGYAVFLSATLGYLGFGVQPPSPDWGLQVSENQALLTTAPWTVLFPALAIAAVVVGVSLLADGLREELLPSARPANEAPFGAPALPLAGAPAATFAASGSGAPTPADVPLLEIEALSVSYDDPAPPQGRQPAEVQAVRGFSLRIGPGEAVGLAGESGCGKTTVALAIMGYLPRNARVVGGRIRFCGQPLSDLDGRALQALRGRRLAMVYQNPASALNPSLTAGQQVAEVYRTHLRLDRRTAWQRAVELLERLQVPRAADTARLYPHQLSAGMQQRVVLAMALAGGPDLLVLDEPTSSLDAPTRGEIVQLLKEVRREFGVAMLFISHDLALLAEVCQRVVVMYAGEPVEVAPADALFGQPRHPYTLALLRCARELEPIPGSPPHLARLPAGCALAPRCALARPRCHTEHPPLLPAGADRLSRCPFWPELAEAAAGPAALEPAILVRSADPPPGPPPGRTLPAVSLPPGAPLLEVRDLGFRYRRGLELRGVSFTIRAGETLALVGRSGSGKTTVARLVAGLLAPQRGEIRWRGRPLAPHVERRRQEQRRAIQMVFQNPETTLNPRHTVERILTRAVRRLSGLQDPAAVRARVVELLVAVQMGEAHLARYPAELSGGERQRVAIARALAGQPELVILDEVTSALDVSVQAAVLRLLLELQRGLGVAYLFISHDLALVRALAGRAVMLEDGELFDVPDDGQAQDLHPADPLERSAGCGSPGRHPRWGVCYGRR